MPFTPEPTRSDRFYFPEIACPSCGKPTDGTHVVPGPTLRAPGDGDVSLCFYCAQPSIFVVNAFGAISLRALTPDELAEFAVDFGDQADALADFNRRNPPGQGGRPG